MNYSKYFHAIDEDCYINSIQCRIYDTIIPANSVFYHDSDDSTVYICSHFPNYNGNINKLIIPIFWYDYSKKQCGSTLLKNKISVRMFIAWDLWGRPKAAHVKSCNYENMMKHDRRHKHGSGQRVVSNTMTDSLRYKQVTEAAYWANLYNNKSGNASVVASNIRQRGDIL